MKVRRSVRTHTRAKLARGYCFVTIQTMQSFNTKPEPTGPRQRTGALITVGRAADVLPGRRVTVELSDGGELALFNIDGEFHAIDNFCPHKGAPLLEGNLTGYTIECDWHGWQFDVRSGRCFTVNECVQTYRVVIEDDWIKIEV
jgi:nitrite reductase (NADH) small subunit